jgi:polyribonucleotide 5'-hydroxyl-kinase
LTLQKGAAEIFGTELGVDIPGEFVGPQNFAVYSWQGCTVQLQTTRHVHSYIVQGSDTPMPSYGEIHLMLHEQRKFVLSHPASHEPLGEAGADPSSAANSAVFAPTGPRVMVLGPVDHGKSTLCRILLNYCVRTGGTPIFLDLDVGQNSITIPGVLAAVPLHRPFDLREGIERSPPLALFFGAASPDYNLALFRHQVEHLMALVERRLQADLDTRASGLIINTHGWVDGPGFELLTHAIVATQADTLLVIDSDRLYADLSSRFPDRKIIKLRKSAGVVARTRSERKKARNSKFREYFYGPQQQLCPSTVLLEISSLQFYHVVGAHLLTANSAMPLGSEHEVDPTRLVSIEPSFELLHSVLAVSYAKTREDALTSNLAGFIYVTSFSEDRTKITCLSPCPGPLPGHIIIVGDLKWFE